MKYNDNQKCNNFGTSSSNLNDPSVQEAGGMNNGYLNNNYGSSSSSNPFSNKYYKSIKEKSNRSLDYDFEDEEYYNENELAYKILNNSKFQIHTSERGGTPFIIYDEIKIMKDGKEIENKTIEEIKNASTNNWKLSNILFI